MESLLFHPKVVHLPIALAVLMPFLSGAVAVSWWRRWIPARGWLLIVGLQAILLAGAITAARTGEVEEERVEGVVAEAAIEAHEEAAETFVWASGAALVLMLVTLAFLGGRAGRPLAAASVAATLLVFGLGYRTGHAGGELVYRHGAAAAYLDQPASAPSGPVHRDHQHHEDDD